MSLTSSSTYSDAVAQYLDNLSWEGDIAKARSALEAVRFLHLKRPMRSGGGDGRTMDFESLAAARQQLEEYLAIHDTTNRPKASFVQGRALNVL